MLTAMFSGVRLMLPTFEVHHGCLQYSEGTDPECANLSCHHKLEFGFSSCRVCPVCGLDTAQRDASYPAFEPKPTTTPNVSFPNPWPTRYVRKIEQPF